MKDSNLENIHFSSLLHKPIALTLVKALARIHVQILALDFMQSLLQAIVQNLL
jgi:hypothetical protein